jgi:hypothetical protein
VAGIPESQLDTWAGQGSITQSSATYTTIKNALEASGTAYGSKSYSVFLQGSYGNDTNIYAESDVDVVIKLESTFYRDISELPSNEKDAYNLTFSNADYNLEDFKRDVLAHLASRFGSATKPGKKAVLIEANDSRRKTDVIIAAQYRRYHRFRSLDDQIYDEGIMFRTSSGTDIVNYPRQHAKNCTTKHQATSRYFKPMVRILKNARSRMVEKGLIASGIAPSYYIEGLLYNVPSDRFDGTYRDAFANCINWLQEADRSNFVCANEQYYLLRDDPDVTWSAVNCTAFLDGLVQLWDTW